MRYLLLFSYGKVISMILTSSPLTIVISGLNNFVPEEHRDLSFEIFALEWLFINSLATFLTT